MILKRMDDTILSGAFDCRDEESEVTVCIVEPELGEKQVRWKDCPQNPVVRKEVLHYNDVADGANTLFGSWQKFYAGGNSFGKRVLYNGSKSIFQNRFPCFGGIAKAAVYLRYSKGFLEYLSGFDPEQADRLKAEIVQFETMLEPKTKKMPTNWSKYESDKGEKKWPIACVTRLSNGKTLVLFLEHCEDKSFYAPLEEAGVDIAHSLELMEFLTTPKTEGYETISDLFQMGSGLGRNPFGRTYESGDPDSEYRRAMGIIQKSSREIILDLWSKNLKYKVCVSPIPDNSWLFFFPEGNLKYSKLKDFIDRENLRRAQYFEALKAGKGANEDAESVRVLPPDLIPPVEARCTIFLVNIEEGQKKRLLLQQVFPSVSLQYFRILNEELLRCNLQYSVVKYMKGALTGQDKDTPSVYSYWTEIFTAALQKQLISGIGAYLQFQRFARIHSGERLIEKLAAREYFRLIGKLLSLQHLIVMAKNYPERLNSENFQKELREIERFDIQPTTGVFGPMKETIPDGAEIIGKEHYDLLREKEKAKIDRFIQLSRNGVPDGDFRSFVRGGLTGMLLQNLGWCVQQEGRRFSATQGRQPTRLRGAELTGVFIKGVRLLMNLDKAHCFNCQMLPFVKSVEEESRRDAFNTGLIMGMTFIGTNKTADNEGDNSK